LDALTDASEPMAKRETSILSNLMARLRGAPQPPLPMRQPPRPFQAISIFRGVVCCSMAKQFSEHRFLARDAPPLPLAGCSMPGRCECRYLKHKDRRVGERRLVDFSVANSMYSSAERRLFAGRRKK
jgi:hypothetical protein